MAYKIEYSPESASRYPQQTARKRGKTGMWLIITGLIASMLWMRIKGIPDFLIPGDPEVTKEAAAVFVQEIKTGATVNDAITAFCKTVLDGAGV